MASARPARMLPPMFGAIPSAQSSRSNLSGCPWEEKIGRGRLVVLVWVVFASWPSQSAGDELGWTELPEGVLAGRARLRLEADGHLLRPEFPGAVQLRLGDAKEFALDGDVRLRVELFTAGRERAGRLTLITGALRRSQLRCELEVVFQGLEHAVPARLGAADDRTRIVGFDGGGFLLARGLLTPRSLYALDFSSTDPQTQLRLWRRRDVQRRGASPAGWGPEVGRVRATCTLGSRSERVLLSWRAVAHPFGEGVTPVTWTPPALRRFEKAASLRGWRLRGLSGRKLRERLDDLVAIERGTSCTPAYVEIGDGWQSDGLRPFRGPARNWQSALQPEMQRVTPAVSQKKGAPGGGARPHQATSNANDPAASPDDDPEGSSVSQTLGASVKFLRDAGHVVGVWIVPFGQSEKRFFDTIPEAFIRDAEGRPISDGWLGKYVVDPTSPTARSYMESLFRRLRQTGFGVVRLAGLGRAVAVFENNRSRLADPNVDAFMAITQGLEAMRRGAGDSLVLAGDAGTPARVAGLLDSVQPSLSFDGETVGLSSLAHLFTAGDFAAGTHRVLWNVELPRWQHGVVDDALDPDRVARSLLHWAQVSGQNVVFDAPSEDALEHLLAPGRQRPGAFDWVPAALRAQVSKLQSEPRLRPLDTSSSLVGRRPVMPNAVDRPLASRWIVVSAVDEGDRGVAALFNCGDRAVSESIAPADVGIVRRPDGEVDELYWFDLESERLIGHGWQPRQFQLLGEETRLVAVARVGRRPRIVAVSGHPLGQEKWLDVVAWRPREKTLTARLLQRACAPAGAAGRRVHVLVPAGLEPVRCDSTDAVVNFRLQGRHLELFVGGELDVSFSIEFREATQRQEPPPALTLRVELDPVARAPLVSWTSSPFPTIHDGRLEFQVVRDHQVVASTRDDRVLDQSAGWGGIRRYKVRLVAIRRGVITAGPRQRGDHVETLAESAEARFTFPPVRDLELDRIATLGGKGRTYRRRAVGGGPLTIGGRVFASGLSVAAPGQLDFRLDGAFARFQTFVGIDDSTALRGSAVVSVVGDGRELFRSEVLRGGRFEPLAIDLPIDGVESISLRVHDAGDGNDWDIVSWCAARVTTAAAPSGSDGDHESR